MKRHFTCGFLLAAVLATAAVAEEIKGKITAVEGQTIKISFDTSTAPKVGDKLQIYFEIPGLDDVADVAQASITTVDQGTASATVAEGADKVIVGQLVRVIGSASATPGPSGGAEQPPASGLAAEMTEMAAEIASLLKSKGLDGIAIGQFTGPAQLATSSGPAIAKALADALQAAGLKILKSQAKAEVKGDYLPAADAQSQKPAVMVKARVLDTAGNTLGELKRGIFGAETLAQIFGLTVSLPADQPPAAQDEAIFVGLEKPATTLVGSKVAAGPDSPYAVEVLIKSASGWQPRTPVEAEGFAFLPIQRDESYAVRLINDSPYDAAVKLTIDGLNMFMFSDQEAYRKAGVVIIPAGKSGVVKGWHRTNELSDEFLVTEYAKSEAAKFHSETGIGTITATFRAAWPQDGSPPSDELDAHLAAKSADATGRGPSIEAKYTEVARVFGRMRASISVRYTK